VQQGGIAGRLRRPVMSCAGGFVIYLFGMAAMYFECTATCSTSNRGMCRMHLTIHIQ